MITAAIFDLDGIIVDSEPNYLRSEQLLLAEHGIDFTASMKLPYIGWSTREMLEDLVRVHGLHTPLDELVGRKNEYYLALARQHVTIYPPTRRMVELLAETGYPLALASGSSREVIDVILDHASLAGHFDVVISADEVARGKPAPDLFLAAASRLGAAADQCVVFEDSEPGVKAALTAGMHCVAIPYLPDPPLPEVFHRADVLVTDGMAGFKPDDVLAWIRSVRP